MQPRLSKSRILSHRQCALRLYHELHHPTRGGEPGPAGRFYIEEGRRVGEVARSRFPGGVLVDVPFFDVKQSVARTWELIDDPNVPAVFEASFEWNGVYVRADIMERRHDGWGLWEVKSVLHAKERHLYELALQRTVISLAMAERDGARDTDAVAKAGLLLLNRNYVYEGGEYDTRHMFAAEPRTRETARLQKMVLRDIERARETMMEETTPPILPDEHCYNPYPCPFLDVTCETPEPHELLSMPGVGVSKLEQLQKEGIHSINDFMEEDPMLTLQGRRALKAIRNGGRVIEPGLVEELAKIEYPRMFLDFEAAQAPLPRWVGTRPFERLPFQFSLHIEPRPGERLHEAYLHETADDPRRPLAEALLQATSQFPEAPILSYSAYEKQVIHDLSLHLPDQAESLRGLKKRLVDLLPIVMNHIYDVGFNGGYSIKVVLPALVPELDYSDLEVADGTTASVYFIRMLDQLRLAAGSGDATPSHIEADRIRETTTTPEGTTSDTVQQAGREAKRIRESLWRYCRRDTEAMVALLHALEEEAHRDTP
ncbi:DUF2779 domain-containing protein [bacterium]|nr:DUF2779 domain-containing protein [bacterium]